MVVKLDYLIGKKVLAKFKDGTSFAAICNGIGKIGIWLDSALYPWNNIYYICEVKK